MAGMKLLIISGSFPALKCAVGDYVKKLTENLICKGADVNILTSCDASIRSEGYVHAIIKKWNIFSLFRVLSFIRAERPDAINLQIPTIKYRPILSSIGLMPALSKIFFRTTPFIVTVHDYSIARPIFKIFFLPLLLFSDTIIVTNQEDLEDIIRRFSFLETKLQKIYIGPSIETIDIPDMRKEEFLRKVNYEKGNRFISTFGFIKKDRCVDIVIRSFDKLGREDGALKLIILGDIQNGGDDRYRDYLFELVENLNLKNKICFLGFCDSEEASFYLSLSDLSILLYERGASFRRSSMINYIVRGIPAITNINIRYGIDRDLVDSGMVATVDSIAIDGIYEKARLILYNDNYKNEMKRKMSGARDLFNWAQHADEFMNIYSASDKSAKR